MFLLDRRCQGLHLRVSAWSVLWLQEWIEFNSGPVLKLPYRDPRFR